MRERIAQLQRKSLTEDAPLQEASWSSLEHLSGPPSFDTPAPGMPIQTLGERSDAWAVNRLSDQAGPDMAVAPAASPAPVIQARLTVGPTDDSYEQEAERVSRLVTESPDLVAHPAQALAQAPAAAPIQTSRAGSEAGLDVAPALEDEVLSLRGGGQPLPASEQSFFEERLGHSFADVQIHDSPKADQLNQALNAEAFTVGQDIAFAAGSYAPGTEAGRGLLAHELTHVVQQGGASAPAVQRKTADAAEATEEAAPASESTTAGKDAFIESYKTWLEARLTEVEALQGNDKLERVRGLLMQVEQVSAELIAGTVPQIDQLSTTPAAQDSGQRGYVPPQLIAVVRKLILVTEQSIEGVERSASAAADGSLYEEGNDWNTRLGVPQYRTQSDNLAAPEATCNVTSTAMAMERLGHGRADLLAAIEDKLRESYLKTKEGKEAAKDKQPDQVEVPDTYWTSEATKYLNTVNTDTANYRKIRGGHLIDKDTTVASVAEDFKAAAQPEDLLDFLVYLKSLSRYSITSSTANAQTLIDAVRSDDDPAINVEKIENGGKKTWEQAKADAKTCLEEGGAAVVSFYHKGKGDTGTHIIAIQSVTAEGIIVDDPYGKMNEAYSRTKAGDAYAEAGKETRSATYKNQPDYTDDDDWRVEETRSLSDGESLGDSYEIKDSIMKDAWFYITLWKREQATPAAEAATPGN